MDFYQSSKFLIGAGVFLSLIGLFFSLARQKIVPKIVPKIRISTIDHFQSITALLQALLRCTNTNPKISMQSLYFKVRQIDRS